MTVTQVTAVVYKALWLDDLFGNHYFHQTEALTIPIVRH
jgi:hypothetical protein